MPFLGDGVVFIITQGDALGCELLPFQGVWSKLANSNRPNEAKLLTVWLKRAESPKALSPGQHTGDKQQGNLRPERANALETAGEEIS